MLLLLITYHLSLITISCGTGDDDGRRLGELIVGTWQRGWGEGDVIIEGDTNLEPEHYDEFGDVIYEGQYRCDNNNLKLEFTDEEGRKQKILAQVLSFTEDTMTIRYENEEYNVTVTLILRRLVADTYSSSASAG